MPTQKLICSKCGKELPSTQFFKMREGDYCDMCKSCLTMHIDNQDKQTFLWILEKFDVPYIEKKWIETCNKIYKKNPAKFGPNSVIGTYIRTVTNLAQYKWARYADSDKINFENQKVAEEAAARREELQNDEETIAYVEELQEKLAAGDISTAEFKTLNPLSEDIPIEPAIPEFIKPVEINEEEVFNQLDAKERTYLATKWGTLYKPSEWVRLEDMYSQYEEEYNLNADRRETLIKMCKTSLKMDECLDIGDLTGYKNLSAAWDQLRKSGKFTEAQKTQETAHSLSTIGELVKFCEKDGPIELYIESYTDYPEDKIDITIKDMQAYTYNLVAGDLGLSNLIESFIQKLEQAEDSKRKADEELTTGFVTSAEEEAAALDAMTNEDYIEYEGFIEDEVQKDIDNLFAEISKGGEQDES